MFDAWIQALKFRQLIEGLVLEKIHNPVEAAFHVNDVHEVPMLVEGFALKTQFYLIVMRVDGVFLAPSLRQTKNVSPRNPALLPPYRSVSLLLPSCISLIFEDDLYRLIWLLIEELVCLACLGEWNPVGDKAARLYFFQEAPRQIDASFLVPTASQRGV